MTLKQVAELAAAAASAGPRPAAREFTVHQDLPATLTILRRLTEEQQTAFPGARAALADSASRARRVARSLALRASLLTSFLAVATGLALLAAPSNPDLVSYGAASVLLGAVGLAATLAVGRLAARVRLMRLELTVTLAWVAVCDAVVALELLEDRQPGTLPAAAYAVLTQPWASAVLPLSP